MGDVAPHPKLTHCPARHLPSLRTSHPTGSLLPASLCTAQPTQDTERLPVLHICEAPGPRSQQLPRKRAGMNATCPLPSGPRQALWPPEYKPKLVGLPHRRGKRAQESTALVPLRPSELGICLFSITQPNPISFKNADFVKNNSLYQNMQTEM